MRNLTSLHLIMIHLDKVHNNKKIGSLKKRALHLLTAKDSIDLVHAGKVPNTATVQHTMMPLQSQYQYPTSYEFLLPLNFSTLFQNKSRR